jgi:hypothetical protein
MNSNGQADIGYWKMIEMQKDPVAWMLADKEAEHIRSIMAVQHDFVPEGCVEIPLYTHPVKELTAEDRSMLIRTLKWAEDLLREAGHDEAVNDVQDCLMILRKAQK